MPRLAVTGGFVEEDCAHLVRLAAYSLGANTVVMAAFERDDVRVVAAYPEAALAGITAPVAERLRTLLRPGGAIVTIEDGAAAGALAGALGTRDRSFAGIGLRDDTGEAVGMLWVGAQDGPWSGERAGRLRSLGSLASVVLGRCPAPSGNGHGRAGLSVERLARLQRATRAMSAALTPDEVLRVVVNEGVGALGARHGTVVLTDESRTTLHMRHIVGLADGVLERWHEFPLAMDVPLAVVARTGESMFIGSREEMLRRFPAVTDEIEASDRRAWAIAPIRSGPAAGPVGALMVSWTAPRSFSTDERGLLEAFANLCGPVLHRAETYEHMAEVATALQTSLLPSDLPVIAGIEMHARYVPTGYGNVGGDWYDALTLQHDRLGLIVGDVVGHGIWAAAQMGQIRHAVRTLAYLEQDPTRVLDLFDAKVAQYGESVMATVFVGWLDRKTRRLVYAEAGHPPGMIKRVGGRVEILETARRPPLGVDRDPGRDHGAAETTLEPGDVLLLYTDGLIERRGEPIDAGIGRLRREFASAPASLAEIADALEERVPERERRDDFALLLVEAT